MDLECCMEIYRRCGLIEPNMEMYLQNKFDDRDHNRDKRSLDAGEIEIETPWMEYDDALETFVVTIGDK